MNAAAREGSIKRRETSDALVLSLAGRALRIDFSVLESLDTASAWLFYRLARRLRGDGVEVAFDNLQAAHADLLDRLAKIDSHVKIEPPRSP